MGHLAPKRGGALVRSGRIAETKVPAQQIEATQGDREAALVPRAWCTDRRTSLDVTEDQRLFSDDLRAGVAGFVLTFLVVLPAVLIATGRFDEVVAKVGTVVAGITQQDGGSKTSQLVTASAAGRTPAAENTLQPSAAVLPAGDDRSGATPVPASSAEPKPSSMAKAVALSQAVREVVTQPAGSPAKAEAPPALPERDKTGETMPAQSEQRPQAALGTAWSSSSDQDQKNRPDAASEPVRQAYARLDAKDISGARTLLKPLAEAGDATALFAMAETYDPNVLKARGLTPLQSDTAQARNYYVRAKVAGHPKAQDRFRALLKTATHAQ